MEGIMIMDNDILGSICPKMGGRLCAESYCDLWDMENKKCLVAVLEEEKIELIRGIRDKLSRTQDKEEVMRVIKNIINHKSILH